MRQAILRIAAIVCGTEAVIGCGTPEAQKREETAEIAKKALSDTSAQIKSLKGGKAMDKEAADKADTTPSPNASAPE